MGGLSAHPAGRSESPTNKTGDVPAAIPEVTGAFNADIAQLVEATGLDPVRWEFESLCRYWIVVWWSAHGSDKAGVTVQFRAVLRVIGVNSNTSVFQTEVAGAEPA